MDMKFEIVRNIIIFIVCGGWSVVTYSLVTLLIKVIGR